MIDARSGSVACVLVLLAACGGAASGSDGGPDAARPDSGVPGDAGTDSGPLRDGGADLGTDAGGSGLEAGTDSGADSGTDSAIDAGLDAGSDAGSDSGTDSGSDGGPDSGSDSGAACVEGASSCESGFRLHVCTGGVDTTTDCPHVCAGTPPACLECVPGATTCASDDVMRCRADGSGTDLLTHCATGCSFGACRVLAPVNLATTTCATTGALDLDYAFGTIAVDTTACTGGAILPQVPSGPSLCVIVSHDVTVRAGVTVRVTGTYGLALVATGRMQIDGVIDASAHGTAPGPGAAHTGDGSVPTTTGGPGCGGAGYGTDGGRGSSGLAGGGAPGLAYGATSLAPIAGGSSGASLLSSAGAGGGALELVGCDTLALGATAVVNAGGGGGGGAAFDAVAGAHGASGGGSGGAIILEAGDLVMAAGATIVANGGAGGCGGTTAPYVGGADGTTSLDPAAPVGGACTSGATYGAGGYALRPAADAPAATIGGGGGGAVGRIRIGERVFSPDPGVVYSPFASFVSPTIL